MRGTIRTGLWLAALGVGFAPFASGCYASHGATSSDASIDEIECGDTMCSAGTVCCDACGLCAASADACALRCDRPPCRDNEGCDRDEYCRTDRCGGLGECTARPRSCASDGCARTCGCNGQLYCSECEAALDGVSLAPDPICDRPPPGCRPGDCGPGAYCRLGPGCDRSNASCVPRPTECPDPGGVPTCGCSGTVHLTECTAELLGDTPTSDDFCATGGFGCTELCTWLSARCGIESFPFSSVEECGDACTGSSIRCSASDWRRIEACLASPVSCDDGVSCSVEVGCLGG